MNNKEALIALAQGKKIKPKGYSGDKYEIYFSYGRFIDSNGRITEMGFRGNEEWEVVDCGESEKSKEAIKFYLYMEAEEITDFDPDPTTYLRNKLVFTTENPKKACIGKYVYLDFSKTIEVEY